MKNSILCCLLFCSLPFVHLYGQCDLGIQVQPNSFDVTIKTPQPGSNYSWFADTGQNGNGLSFSIPRNSTLLTVLRDGARAAEIPIHTSNECFEEIGGFVFNNPEACNSCVFQFTPLNNLVFSHLWDFGDGSTPSTDVMPTHTYLNSGTYTVTHTVTYSWDGSISTTVCTQEITANCGTSSQISERVECCNLYLNLCGNNQSDCSHLWQVLNANNQVVLSSTEVSPEFLLSNINTYNNNSITIRHTTVCNGVVNVETIPYTIQNQGIFVGDPTVPVNTVVQYSTATGPLNNNQPLFPSLTVANQNIYVQNVLEINVTPVTFDHDQVCFANDAGIDVAANRTFNVKTANRLYNGCTHAWRGIVTRGRLDMNGNPPTGGPGQENEVRGAVFAVRPEGTNANISLVRTKFFQNFISLYSDVAFTSYIQNNLFHGQSGSLPPLGLTSIAAVSAETGGYSQSGSFAGIFVRNITFHSPLANEFRGMANGYYLLNTNGLISNDEFHSTNIYSAYASGRTGHGIYFRHDGGVGRLTATKNYFGTLETSIRAISAIPGTRVVIGGFSGTSNNTGNVRYGFLLEQRAGGRFDNTVVSHNDNVPADPFGNTYAVDSRIVGIGFRCDPGASLVSNVDIFNNNVGIKVPGGDCIVLEGPNPGSGNIKVYNNDVSLHETGGRCGIHLLNFRGADIGETNIVNLKFGSGDPYGIWLENSLNNTIDDNTINGDLQTNLQGRGIQLDNSPSNAVTNNRIYNTFEAMLINGDCSAQNQIRCNRFYNSFYGMHYTELARTGIQLETGNRWESAGYNPGGSLIGARHDSPDLFFVELSTYRTLQGTSTQYPRTFELQSGILPSDWFVPGSDASCGQEPPPHIVSEGEIQAAGAGFTTGNDFEDGYNWVSRRLLYRKLRENPNLVSSDSTIQAFYQNATNAEIGAYDRVDERLMTAVPLSVGTEQQLQSYQSAADNAAATLADKEAAIWTGNPTETQLQTLLDEFAAAASDYAAANAQINNLLATWQSNLSTEMSDRGTENAGLGGAETWENREKTINGLWLGKVHDDQWLTGTDLAYIRETAEMCPWYGGLGVYKARMLWNRLSDEMLTPSDCAGTYREGPKQTAVTGFRLYPNPAQGQVVIELPAEWVRDGAVQYRLHNALGALAHSGTAAKGAQTVFLPLTGLPNGLYVCQVLRDGRALGATKLSIVKN